MKKPCVFVIALLLAGSVFGAEPAMELRGILAADGVNKFSLLDKSNGTSRWVEVGQSFAGFKVAAYDAATETVTLSKDGSEIRLRLMSAQVKEAAPTMTAAEVTRAVLNNLRQISAAADQYYLEYGGKSVALAELVGPTKYIKRLVPVDGESYDGLQLTSGETLKVTTSRGISVSYAP